ncbi:oligosaccharide flippase family protein [Methylacidiphilum caldifontis]|uniref:lipopolysaccharide biosynthesis protein n=1 Tax=Methylacidiphilum caldifontis TaxID=2795386 RepID=UPI001A8F22A7|nr:oligosaccharide flippase family protein [Methylacidiphilum caldifontis]QSR88586.1 oligosaccharide flippase family protein [Methylacidiphilum caldifontis]
MNEYYQEKDHHNLITFEKKNSFSFCFFLSSFKRHLKNLFALWSSASIGLLSNGIVLFMLAATVSPKIFALYAIGQAITFLANAWTDGGISLALQNLSSQEKNSKSLFDFYYKEGVKLSLKLGISLGLVLAICLFIFHVYGSFAKELSLGLMFLFFICGVFQNRTGFCSSFLYALGNFKSYSGIQALGPLSRLFILTPLVILLRNKINVATLLSVDLFSFFINWILASFLLHYQKKKLHPIPLFHKEEIKIKEELIRFIRPSIQANVLLSLSHTLGTFGGAFFGGASTVALYTIYQKMNQIVFLILGPFSVYFSRKLKLLEDDQQRYKKSKLFIFFAFPLSILLVFILFCGYLVGERLFSHYAFHALPAFEMFLLCNFLGNIYLIFDNILVSWKYSGHRLMSSFLLIGKLLLYSLLKPSSVIFLFGIDALFLFLTDCFFFYKFLSFGRNPIHDQG